MFKDMFGLEENRVTKGFKISNKQKEELKNFVSQKKFQCNYNQSLPYFNLSWNFLQIGDVSKSLNAILFLLQDRFDGWLNDEVRNLFIDSIDLHNVFTTNTFPDNLPLYAVNIFRIIQLFKYGECSPSNQYCLNIDDANSEKIKNYISNRSMVSSIANIMEIYKLKPKYHITNFFGTLYVNQIHYVSVFIDTESRRVYTCDSLPHASNYQTDTIILIRKLIAKSMSLIDY